MSVDRRQCIKSLLALSAFSPWTSVWPKSLCGQPGPQRFALLVGNRKYPPPHDLPPTHKNVRDLGVALKKHGFVVTEALDQDWTGMSQRLTHFVQQIRACSVPPVVMFYFTGHGMQWESENLLLGAGVAPKGKRENLIAKSLKLQRELMKSLPQNARGLTMTVIDACRTDVVNSLTERGDGLNQVEAPVGGLIVFSAQAGRPAIAPDSPDRNTFFTECLVQNLLKADEWMTFPELFQWVKLEVNDVMSNHPLPIVRKLAQDPFIADNSRLPLTLSGAVLNGASPLRSLHRLEVDAFEQLHALTWPTDVVAQARQFVVRFPKSPLVNKVRLMDKGAQQALTVLKRPDVRLFRSAFEVPAHWAESEPQYRVMAHEDLCRAARGDKDAALRLGRVYQQSWTVVPDEEPRAKLQYRQEAWMRYATALGNGIAAYELGLHFRAMGQPALAAEYESRALDLGFETPQGLTHSRK